VTHRIGSASVRRDFLVLVLPPAPTATPQWRAALQAHRRVADQVNVVSGEGAWFHRAGAEEQRQHDEGAHGYASGAVSTASACSSVSAFDGRPGCPVGLTQHDRVSFSPCPVPAHAGLIDLHYFRGEFMVRVVGLEKMLFSIQSC
jgi:hypothetical protein